MPNEKPIRTFTAKDKDGAEFKINVFTSVVNLDGNSIPDKTYKDELFYTSDRILLDKSDSVLISEEKSLTLYFDS